jgi:signal transduction histidine kinase
MQMNRRNNISAIVRWLFKILLVLSCLSAALADDLITSRSYWEDTTQQASLEQAQGHEFTPYTGVLRRGYTRSAVWIRLEVSPPPSSREEDRLILRIRPIYLDEITLHDPLNPQSPPRVAGDRSNLHDEEYRSISHTFVIPAGDKPRNIWLRVKTTSTSLINVEAFTTNDMTDREFKLLLGNCLALSLIAIFLIVVFINWMNDRESLYAIFMARHALYFVYIASMLGFFRYFLDGVLDATYLDLGYNWLVVSVTGFSIWFESRFLQEYAPPLWARLVINGLLAWSGLAAMLLFLGEIQLALKFNVVLVGVTMPVFLAVASVFIDDKKAKSHLVSSLLRKRVVLAYYASITVLIVFIVLPFWGGPAGTEFSINGSVYYAICSGLVMTVVMQLRVNQLRTSNIQYEKDLVLAQQQRELEQVRLQEQSQLLTMLMHELKTPLSVIDLAQQATSDREAQGYVARNVAIIKDILNKCLNADRIALGKLDVEMQSVLIADILHDLRHPYGADAYRIEVEIRTDKKTINTDYQCLLIILNNLLDNALRYGNAEQPVRIQVSNMNNPEGLAGLVFTVINKTGMASWPDPDRVFHKYYRSAGAQSISGTGLGLFLVASIASIIGGSCRYAPDETHVKFELWLPH